MCTIIQSNEEALQSAVSDKGYTLMEKLPGGLEQREQRQSVFMSSKHTGEYGGLSVLSWMLQRGPEADTTSSCSVGQSTMRV